jgi:tRNA pseudouridine38-40 synthase
MKRTNTVCVAKMHRYLIRLSYDGSNYHGWQIQPNGNSVQEEIQKALSTLLRFNVEIVGAGRTDAGVHARDMAAHFDVEDGLDGAQLAYRLNRILPRDISVQSVDEVKLDLHARFSAVSRTYHYYIHTRKDPFLRDCSCELHYKLDFQRMNEAASHLLGTDDFKAFCKSHTDVKTTVCNVTEARWLPLSDHSWYFEITANRFLRNMVRAVVGTLIEVGRGRISVEEFVSIVKGRERTQAGESMPAHALFLEKVKY